MDTNHPYSGLRTDLLLAAYRHGIFPMAVNDQGEIGWFSPDPRAIIPLDETFHVPRSLLRVLKEEPFEIRIDTSFEQVIHYCATVHGKTWISPAILDAYLQLHYEGHAHCVECWQGEKLVGGLYGVAIGGAFFGESMFSLVTNASKVALVALVKILRQRGFTLLDTQWRTPHLAQFGTKEIPRTIYLSRLQKALLKSCCLVEA